MGTTLEQDISYVVSRIRADERSKIVAWLREGVDADRPDARGNVTAGALESIAVAIERVEFKR